MKKLFLLLIVFYTLSQSNNFSSSMEFSGNYMNRNYVRNETKNINPIFLGNPFSKGTYSRNVWDMQLYKNKIYLGHGNSSNIKPDANSGVDGIISFDIKSKKFSNEYDKLSDKQIDIFKIINGILVIPGHDRISGSISSLYMNEVKWIRKPTIPHTNHIYDIAYYKGAIYLGTASSKLTRYKNDLFVSKDIGDSWTNLNDESNGRIYNLFVFHDKLYFSTSFSIYQKNQIKFIEGSYPDISMNTMIKNDFASNINDLIIQGEHHTTYKFLRIEEWKNNLYYIIAYTHNDHQSIPISLYSLTSMDQPGNILNLPEKTAVPYDIIKRNDKLLILANKKLTDDKYEIILYLTKDGKYFSEIFRFKYGTLARSFEETNGDFYIGMGCTPEHISKLSGNVLKIEYKSYK